MLPKRDLEALLANIPRLLAEDQVIDIQSISLGNGNLPRAEQSRQLNRLSALIDEGEMPAQARRSTPAEVLQFARTAKVKVVAGG